MNDLLFFAGKLFGITLAIAIPIAILSLNRKKTPARTAAHGYTAKPLLTPNEVHFYHLLQQATQHQYYIMAQVSMGALIDNEGYGKQYWYIRTKYAMKMIDFVICDKKTLKPLLIVELDDKTHVKEKDAMRDLLTRTIGLRTIRIESKKKPKADELRDILNRSLPSKIDE